MTTCSIYNWMILFSSIEMNGVQGKKLLPIKIKIQASLLLCLGPVKQQQNSHPTCLLWLHSPVLFPLSHTQSQKNLEDENTFAFKYFPFKSRKLSVILWIHYYFGSTAEVRKFQVYAILYSLCRCTTFYSSFPC